MNFELATPEGPAGSRFAVQYQVAVKVIRARPALVPVTIIRRPTTVPASSVPAAMVSFSGVTATSRSR